MVFTPESHLPTPGQHGHGPQRHTAAGTAAPTTTDKGNTVPQRANPTQMAYARLRRERAGPRSALRHEGFGSSLSWTLMHFLRLKVPCATEYFSGRFSNSTCTNYFDAATHNKRRFQFRLVNRVFRVLPDVMGKSLVITVRSSTKRNNKNRVCS